MTIREIVVPRVGEGIRQALVTALLKGPGERVGRDEPLYEIETDKATLTVESPCDGVLSEWMAGEGEAIAVGAPIARIEVECGAGVWPARDETEAERAEETVRLDAEARANAEAGADFSAADRASYESKSLAPRQRALAFRLRRSAQIAIPATLARPLSWAVLRRARETLLRENPALPVGEFDPFAWCVARAAAERPAFRSVLESDDRVREYRRLNLGIAVQRSTDELLTAVVREADALDFAPFVGLLHEAVARAMEGDDQADESVQMIVSCMSASAIAWAIPVLVAPAAATVFLGAPTAGDFPSERREANLAMTFDHRLINGAGAAEFLDAVVANLEEIARPADVGQEGAAQPVASESGSAPAGQTPVRRWLEPDDAGGAEKGETPVLLVSRAVGEMLDLSGETLDPSVPLRNFGMTSLMCVQLSRRLGEALGIVLPPTLVWNYPTIAEIARHLSVLANGSRRGESSSWSS